MAISSRTAAAKPGSTSLPPYSGGQPAPRMPVVGHEGAELRWSGRVPVRCCSSIHSGRKFRVDPRTRGLAMPGESSDSEKSIVTPPCASNETARELVRTRRGDRRR